MLTRRELLALVGVATLAACGDGGPDGPGGDMELVRAEVPRAAAPPEARAAAAEAVTAFTADLYGAVGGPGAGNVVCSPYSVAVALGMTLQGARGATAAEMLAVLHASDAAAFASGLNGLEAELARRPGEVTLPDGEKARVDLSSATSLWGQRGVRWRPEFLDVLAREFGAGLRAVDYERATEQARAAINAWVSEQTRERIPELLLPGILHELTRLTLVNAIWFKAPWQTPFVEEVTRPGPFHTLDGSDVTADLMHDSVDTARYASGDGWQAVDLPYANDDLAMAVIVPDAGRFAAVTGTMGTLLPQVLAGFEAEPVEVTLPRWKARTKVELSEALGTLGMPRAFSDAAELDGMVPDLFLKIDKVVHEGWVAVDEAGTEAAAATAVTVMTTSLPPQPRHHVVADRPFLFVIHDRGVATPLFVGQVLDPTAGAG